MGESKKARSRHCRVQSIGWALDILEFLGRSEEESGVSEIGAATGLSAGTVHRLLPTLDARGYVHRNEETRKHGLGLKSLSMVITVRERLGPLALPFLEELAEVSQETANLAILEQNSVMYVEQATPKTRMLRIFVEPGNRIPLHSCGMGKVWLAYQPPRLLEFVVGQTGLPVTRCLR